MADNRVVLNPQAIQAFLKSTEVGNELMRRAKKIEAAAGEGFEAFEFVGHDRAHAGVHAATWAGFRREHDDRALSKSIDAGGG